MTEAIGTGPLAAVLGGQEPARGRQKLLADAATFRDTLQDEGRGRMPPVLRVEDAQSQTIPARLLDKIAPHWRQAGAEEGAAQATEELPPRRARVDGEDAPPEEAEEEAAAAVAKAEPERQATAHDQPEAAPAQAPAPTPPAADPARGKPEAAAEERPASPEDAASPEDGPARSAKVAAQAAPPAAETPPPMVERQQGARAGNGPEPAPPPADRQRPDPLLAAGKDGAQEQAPGGSGGRDADSGKPPLRIVSLQSAPAIAPAPFLGAGATGTALVSALGADAAFGAAAAEAAKAIAAGRPGGKDALHTLKIQLHPAELGMVTARLSISGDQLIVEMQVETAEARQRLNADGEAMTRALRALGYEVDRVTVQQAPPSAVNNGSAATGGRETAFHQGPGEGHQQGDNSARSQRDGGGSGQQPDRSRTSEGRKDAGAGDSLYI